MKYTLSQYVHDGFRLKLIDAEKRELMGYHGSYEFISVRMRELIDEELEIQKRMSKFEKHPNNR